MKQGQYAEIMTEYAEHIYRENINQTERNYRFTASEGTSREVDVCTILTSGEMIAFEVRDRKSTQGIDWIDQIIGKYDGSPFSQIWLCTFDGCSLSSEAIKKLNFRKIGWRDFTLVKNMPDEGIGAALMVEGISPIKDDIEILVNDKKFRDLQINTTGQNNLSFQNEKINQFRTIAAVNFLAFYGINFFEIEDELDVDNIKNNFGANYLKIKTVIPLQHKVFVDFF